MVDKPGPFTEADKDRALELLCAIIDRELACPAGATPNQHEHPPCPRCNSRSTHKRGHDSAGKQRFHCNACGRSFTTATGKALGSTRIPPETWKRFAACQVAGLALRQSAAQCNVCLKTAFYMRKRLNQTIVAYAMAVKKQRKQALSTGDPPRPDVR